MTTPPFVTGRGRPTGSRNSADGEMPSKWKTVAAKSGGRSTRLAGNAPSRSLAPTTWPPAIPAPATAKEKHDPQ